MPFQNKFPLYFPYRKNEEHNGKSIIAADVKQDKTVLAHFTSNGGKLTQNHRREYLTKEFSCFSDMLKLFLRDVAIEKTDKISVSVPGPVMNGFCVTQHLPFELSETIIKTKTSIENVYLINDVEALAYGVGGMQENDFQVIHQGNSKIRGNVAIIAPGKGLGEAGMFWDGTFLRPFATEGGHSEFSPRTDEEVEFYQFLKKIYGIVTWESVLSYEGIFNIFRFLRDVKHQRETNVNFTDSSCYQEIIKEGLSGNDRTCVMALERLSEFIAREAHSLTLKLKSVGGLIITGDIVKSIEICLKNSNFYENFIVSDKMENILCNTPIYLLTNGEANLLGAAYYGAFGTN
ncbi:glucokinase [Riemerella columbipharyngis]|uniref:Glucokinase n=1 Tax=Riemerella columbipharyngis TaxID=1071918 RepID=A0A1G6ZJP2_9FLAO|nr:glucokinase [Riemerella columbipharyngis]SDE02974.1 glucokinase [Riemerella columbipharyngis]